MFCFIEEKEGQDGNCPNKSKKNICNETNMCPDPVAVLENQRSIIVDPLKKSCI